MTSLRTLIYNDKRYSRFTRNVGKSKVNRSITFPIAADSMIPAMANALGMNCNQVGRHAFVHYFESRLGKAKTFAFKVACQLRDDVNTIISIFKPDAPFEERQAAFEASLKAQREEQQAAVPNADKIADEALSEFDGREEFKSNVKEGK